MIVAPQIASAERLPSFVSIPAYVAAQAAERPDGIAIVAGPQRLTYSNLEGHANRLARHLLSWKAGPQNPVGVFLRRSPEMVIAALAVMKAGCPYIPLDPAYPAQRLAFMVENAGVSIVVGGPKRFPCNCHWIDFFSSDTFSTPDQDPCVEIQASDLAYIIYTSGSTGTPKASRLHMMVYRISRLGIAPLSALPLPIILVTLLVWASMPRSGNCGPLWLVALQFICVMR